MEDKQVICIDIGSTWTKAARFRLVGNRFDLEARAVVPTTTDYLPNGFYEALSKLNPEIAWQTEDPAPIEVRFSSSAKGGLNIAVVGLVPELTLQIGRLAAFSAGARISAAFPFKLTQSFVKTINDANPDILLLCGGTDGGNERYVCENAKVIARSDFSGTVVYAGNHFAVDQIKEILADKKLLVTENLMPDFGKLNIQPARQAIRQVFLQQIVMGKGLNKLVEKFSLEPVPTPLAVFQLTEAIGKHVSGWQNFAMIDMGGATTDIYSFSPAHYEESGTVLKGILEPTLKRTVEGDLGIRVSARAVVETAATMLHQRLNDAAAIKRLESYVALLVQNTSHLPDRQEEEMFDRLLTDACIHNAFLRHAGYVERVYTARGPVWAQSGKDLRKTAKIIGTGGYLTRMVDSDYIVDVPPGEITADERIPLVPEKYEYFVDTNYIFPLLGCLANDFPVQSATTAVSSLKRIQSNESVKESCHREFT
jgi:uncharacterized protein (TIGR01319 family)